MKSKEESGLFVIYKEEGMTSFQVVEEIKRKFHISKVGHTGTLDPLASGILLICVNKATRLIEYLQNYEKEYYVEGTLGYISDTYDIMGNVKKFVDMDSHNISVEQIKNILFDNFSGEIMQEVPAFSAAKHKGKPLYKYARQNIKINKSKSVHVYCYNDIKCDGSTVSFDVCVNKGTYVRSLMNDLGAELGTGAVVKKLIRLTNGPYNLSNAKKLNYVKKEDMISFNDLLSDLPSYSIDGITLKRIMNGTTIYSSYILKDEAPKSQLIKILMPDNKRCIAIGRINNKKKIIKPEKVFTFQLSEKEIKEIAAIPTPPAASQSA